MHETHCVGPGLSPTLATKLIHDLVVVVVVVVDVLVVVVVAPPHLTRVSVMVVVAYLRVVIHTRIMLHITPCAFCRWTAWLSV